MHTVQHWNNLVQVPYPLGTHVPEVDPSKHQFCRTKTACIFPNHSPANSRATLHIKKWKTDFAFLQLVAAGLIFYTSALRSPIPLRVLKSHTLRRD